MRGCAARDAALRAEMGDGGGGLGLQDGFELLWFVLYVAGNAPRAGHRRVGGNGAVFCGLCSRGVVCGGAGEFFSW